MEVIAKRPESLTKTPFTYCPGCLHGVAHRLIAEAVDEYGLINQMAGVAPVGCSVFAYKFFNFDMAQAAHGRAPAVATGMKRARPDMHVFTYQGDGDLAAIGTAEIVHAANRGEHFTGIFVNNAIYGMTGGQMAPTTLVGQKATTAPYGRDPVEAGMGYPIQVCEMLATLGGTKYLARGAVNTPANVKKTKQYIKKAFEMQLRGEGFGMVEILSPCPTNWQMKAGEAVEWLEQNMMPFYKLGEIKNTLEEAAK